MSLMHSIVAASIMRSKRPYTPDNKPDYVLNRKNERKQNRFVIIPPCVRITETRLGNVHCEKVSEKGNPQDKIIFYIHGGGFVTGEPFTRRQFTAYVAEKLGYNVIVPDYRLAPENKFPAGCNDCLSAYRALLKDYAAEKIIFIGESAGGNLVLSTLLQAKDKGLPLPAGVFAISPSVQFDRVLPSYEENREKDCMVDTLSGEVVDAYFVSPDETLLKNPYAAPYYGDFSGCPPIYLFASETEVLRDDSIILYEKLIDAGQPCRLWLRDKMMHACQVIPYFPEARKDLEIIRECFDSLFNGTGIKKRNEITIPG